MSVNQLILRNLKKNLKNYYLYVFALIFSVALYFAFVTLQYDPAMNEAKESIKGVAALRAATVLLIAIVTIFLLYANTIFIKRRGKEIGLFQLIGMTKSRIFIILSAENFILYFGSILIGIFLGFSSSRLLTMILFKITGVNVVAVLYFSSQALIQTLIVFGVIYLLILVMNYLFIKRQTILSLFKVISTSEEQVRSISFLEMVIGNIGILSILTGYYVSARLFTGAFSSMNELFLAMIFILGSVIFGTYLFYKGSVRFIFHLIRKKRDGYLSIRHVLSLSSIMFRMKSNALLLTLITTISALAIGLLSLSYISYYSAEQTAQNMVAADFSFAQKVRAEMFKKRLNESSISFTEKQIEVIQVDANLSDILDIKLEGVNFDPNVMTLPVISDKDTVDINVSTNQVVFSGTNDLLRKFMGLQESGKIELQSKQESFPLQYLGLKKEYLVSNYFTAGGLPVAIVDESLFELLQNDLDPEIQKASTTFIGITLSDQVNEEKSYNLYKEMPSSDQDFSYSRLGISQNQKQTMGLIMFIVGFLGLTFLITSGCILYFKQMGESEEEKSNYTILRKLGFTQRDLLSGIKVKQIFNFGIPLAIGLFHSYFAVQSGWFLFGTEVWTPMILVMVLYTGLYSVFGILSVLYYKKVIKEAL